MSREIKDITGRRFGKWTVLEPTTQRAPNGCVKWLCVCDCGTYRNVGGNLLRIGLSKSCGCTKNRRKK